MLDPHEQLPLVNGRNPSYLLTHVSVSTHVDAFSHRHSSVLERQLYLSTAEVYIHCSCGSGGGRKVTALIN